VEDSLSVNQFRALVILASRGPLHSAALAQEMGLHPSNATRTCDRLVALGLLDRLENPADRRHLLLTLTRDGKSVVRSVTNRRRRAIRDILARMPNQDRGRLTTSLAVFTAASGEPEEQDLWTLGWATAPTAPARTVPSADEQIPH
jgi:DNA-binding MarR family transcriptional regulator